MKKGAAKLSSGTTAFPSSSSSAKLTGACWRWELGSAFVALPPSGDNRMVSATVVVHDGGGGTKGGAASFCHRAENCLQPRKEQGRPAACIVSTTTTTAPPRAFLRFPGSPLLSALMSGARRPSPASPGPHGSLALAGAAARAAADGMGSARRRRGGPPRNRRTAPPRGRRSPSPSPAASASGKWRGRGLVGMVFTRGGMFARCIVRKKKNCCLNSTTIQSVCLNQGDRFE